MKGKKCGTFIYLLVGLLQLLAYIFTSENASAIQIDPSLNFTPTWRTSPNPGFYRNASGTQYPFSIANDDAYFVMSQANGEIWRWVVYTNETIPANTLIMMDYTITQTSSNMGAIKYYGSNFNSHSKMFTISEDCFDPNGGRISGSNAVVHSFTCHAVIYNAEATNYIGTAENSRTLEHTASNNWELTFLVSRPRVLQLVNDGLSLQDRQWLSENLSIMNQEQIDKLDEILENMPAGSSQADIQEAVEDAQSSHDDKQQEKYEDQQENVDGGADDAGEEAEAATSSLIDTGKSIIETIRDTPATNCVIRVKRGVFDTGNLNLCNVPQEIRTVISTIITIPVTLAALHIAYTTVMLYLNTVRKEQE